MICCCVRLVSTPLMFLMATGTCRTPNVVYMQRLKIPGFNFIVSFDTIMNTKKKDEIREEAKRLAGGKENNKKWLLYYWTAKKAVKERLTEEERKMFDDEVDEWTTNGIPSAVQAE